MLHIQESIRTVLYLHVPVYFWWGVFRPIPCMNINLIHNAIAVFISMKTVAQLLKCNYYSPTFVQRHNNICNAFIIFI